MNSLIEHVFSTQFLIKPESRLGDIPTTKTAYKNTLILAAPAVTEMIFVSLIGMMDTMMVGVLGTYALASVGLTTQPRMLFMSLFFALNVGVTAIVSRRKGAEDQEGANLCLAQALLLTGALSIIMAVFSFTSASSVMFLSGAKEDTLSHATAYFKIISAALPLQALPLAISAAQRGIGNTKISLKINLTANIINVIFNFLLIEGRFGFPRLEVRGAAAATAIGNFVGLIIAIYSLVPQKSYLKLSRIQTLSPDWLMIKLISKIGGNAVFEQICLRIGFLFYARIVAELGTFYFSAHQIGMQMMVLTYTIADGLSVASTSLVGQNLGKKRPDISIIYGKIGQRMALCVSIFMFCVIISVRYIFVRFFTDDPELIKISAHILIIMAAIQPLQTSQVVMAGSLRGAGDTRYVAMTMLLAISFCRPLFSVIIVHFLHMGLTGAWYALFFDQTIRFVMLYKRFAGGRWTSIEI
jgi:putative MATE family efflux protein